MLVERGAARLLVQVTTGRAAHDPDVPGSADRNFRFVIAENTNLRPRQRRTNKARRVGTALEYKR